MAVWAKTASLLLIGAAVPVAAGDMLAGRRIADARAIVESRSPGDRDRLLASDGPERLAGATMWRWPTAPEATLRAALWIDQAADADLPANRRTALDRADELLARARRARPDAPGAMLLRVRGDLVRYGGPHPATLALFARSYRAAGFLYDEGLWRLAFAATYWSRLPAATRHDAIDEAVWLARLDGGLRRAIDRLLAGTPLALPVQLRLLR